MHKLKATINSLGALILGGGLLVSGCAKKQPTLFQSLEDPGLVAQLKSFIAEKQAQANATTNKLPSEVQAFFAVAAKGDWRAGGNAFMELRKQAGYSEHPGKGDERWRDPTWHAVVETWGALNAFGEGDEKYALLFGTNIIASIPAGSIYFGGTDAGRFIVTALQKSHVQGEPFFTLAQGALPDGTYLDYLRGMYGAKISTPTDEDSRNCFQKYMEDVAQRRNKNQLKSGEIATLGADGKLQVSGHMAVVQLKALLAQLVFDKNPDREFYVEESFPFDWMYPYLEPHGLILKLNHQPLPEVSGNVVEQNHAYWRGLLRAMLGDWLTGDTPVAQIAAFAKKTFGEQDFDGFTGDPRFIRNADSHRMFSKLRSSQAGLYAWRMQHASSAVEKERLAGAADFTFRQAWALCPDSTETVLRYVALLMEQKRFADALLVAETAAQLPSRQGQEGQTMRVLVEEIRKAMHASSAGE